jgi:hypothetical protein
MEYGEMGIGVERRWFKFRLTRATAIAAMFAISAVGLSACSPPRSVAAVCHVWDTQALALHNQYQAESDNVSAQSLGDLFAAPANLGRLMGNMAAVAPVGIEADFQALQQAFSQIASSEGQAFTDPLAALGDGLVTSLAVSGSYDRVDSFLSANCGIPGSSPIGSVSSGASAVQTGDSAHTGYGCPTQSVDGQPPFADLLTGGTSEVQLTSELTALKKSRDTQVSTAARHLLVDVQGLSPAPTSSLEALGRLRFTSDNPVNLLQTLENEVASDCGGAQLLGADAVATFQQATPTPGPTGGIELGDSIYGTCSDGDLLGWTAPFSAVYSCGGTIETVNGSTGAITTSAASVLPNGNQDVELVGSNLMWLDADNTPSQGLTPGTWSVTMRVRGLDGSDIADVPIFTTQPTGPGGSTGSAQILASGTSGLVVDSTDLSGNQTVLIFDASGTRIASYPDTGQFFNGDSATFVTNDTVWIGQSGGGMLYDLHDQRSLADLTTGGGVSNAVQDGGCRARVLIEVANAAGSTSPYFVDDSSGSPTLTPVSAAYQGNAGDDSDVAAVVPGGVVTTGSDGSGGESVTLFEGTGGSPWTLPSTVAESVDEVGAWLVVTNTSGTKILVNPTTGAQTQAADNNLQSILTNGSSNDGASQSIVLADPAANAAVVEDSNSTYYDYTYSDVCL